MEVRFHGRLTFTITAFSSEEFDRNPSLAMSAAKDGPVFIVEDGRHAYVLLTIEEYRKIGGKRESIVDLLAMPEAAEIDFEYPRMGHEFPKPANFS